MNKVRGAVGWGDGNGHCGDFGWGREARHARTEDRGRCAARRSGGGLTQKAFARQEGVNYHTLVAWLGRERRAAAALPAATPGKIRFQQLQLGPTPRRAELEVALPGGLVVRGGDAAQVAALVKALTA